MIDQLCIVVILERLMQIVSAAYLLMIKLAGDRTSADAVHIRQTLYIHDWHFKRLIQMETFSALLAICAGNSPVSDEFPVQRPVTRSLNIFFDLRLNWVNNLEAGDLRRYRAHYKVSGIHYIP